jgi:hypothetical protein
MDLLQLYPSLAKIPELLDRWPSLREAIEKQQAAEKAAQQQQDGDDIPAHPDDSAPPKVD